MLHDVILSDELVLPFGAGLLFCLIWLSASYLIALLGRVLEGRATPRALRLRYWPGWTAAGRFVGLSVSVGYLFFLLHIGVFVASDVGLGHIDLRLAWSDLERLQSWSVLALPSLLLLGVLWVPAWRIRRTDLVQDAPADSWSGIVADALGCEVILAILRGSLTPWVGLYWGVWLALAVKIGLMTILPHVRQKLRQRNGRASVYLQWALDSQSATLFTLYGDMTILFAARLISMVCLYALYRGLARLGRASQSVPRRA
jgi:hypothetical protein